MFKLIAQGFRGELSLAKAFWLCVVPITIALHAAEKILSELGWLGASAPEAGWALVLVGCALQVSVFVILWKCSRNTPNSGLGVVVRTLLAIVFLAPVVFLLGLLGMFALLLVAAAHDS